MWDKVFSQAGYAYGTQANDFLQQAFSAIPKGGRVLMLADGEGRNGVFMAEQGYEVVSVDRSAVGLQKAQQLAKQRGVILSTLCIDLAEYQPEANSFDGIISIFCHLPPALQNVVYSMCAQALKPGGFLLLEGYTPKQLAFNTGGPSKAEMMPDLAHLLRQFSGYQVVLGQEIERTLCEGRLHQGLSALVQLLLKK